MKKILILAFQLYYFIPFIHAQTGNVGINTLTPQARVHVIRNGVSGGPLLSNALAIFEDNQSSFIHLSNLNSAESGILSGNQSTLVRSGLIFGSDSSVLFRAGGNVNRMAIKNSNVGINTISPAAMLHVKDGSTLFTGPVTFPGSANPPVNGAGTRMMWYADKAALRAGRVTGTDWDKDSIGLYSFATGINTRALGESSVAMGEQTIASGWFSTSLGFVTQASGLASTAVGLGTEATGGSSFAAGAYTNSIGGSSAAFGHTTSAEGFCSASFGQLTNALGENAATFGLVNQSFGDQAMALGFLTTAKGDNSTAMGEGSFSKAYASLAIGRYNDTTAVSAISWENMDPVFVIGNGSLENGRRNAMTVLKNGRTGINTNAPLAMLHVVDSSVVFSAPAMLPATPGDPPISGAGTRMMWYPDKAAFRAGNLSGSAATYWDKDSIGVNSVAFGSGTRAKGPQSVAFGNVTIASGQTSTAIGQSTTASGLRSFAAGFASSASGQSSTAMGFGTLSSGLASTAIGQDNTASGESSIALGKNTIASGLQAIATGSQTLASGDKSMAAGSGTIASSFTSVAMGTNTIASGSGAFATGFSTHAFGSYSSSMGLGTKSKSYSSFVLGAYNDTTSTSQGTWILTDPLFVVGNGADNNNRANAITVLKNGRTGIGTIAPQKLLHVSGGSSGATATISAMGVFENNTDASINIITPASEESAVYFGNPTNAIHGGIVYNSTSVYGLAFRTNGNVTRAVITDVGDMGLGDNSPNAKLHVSKGVSGATYNGSSAMVIEDDATSFLQFANPSGSEAGILSGTESISLRSGIIFRPDSSVQIRAGGNTTKLTVTKTGNTGIGTLTPQAKLDVNGTAIIGTNGTALTEIIKLTILSDVSNVPANSTTTENFAVPNCEVNSTVFVSPGSNLDPGLVIAYARVTAPGNVAVKFTNTTGAAINPLVMNFYITVIR